MRDAGGRQVRRDQPVAVAVLERFGHPRRGEEQRRARAEDQRRRSHRANTRQGAAAKAAQREDLEQVGDAERHHEAEPAGEHERVESDQPLAARGGDGHHRGGCDGAAGAAAVGAAAGVASAPHWALRKSFHFMVPSEPSFLAA